MKKLQLLAFLSFLFLFGLVRPAQAQVSNPGVQYVVSAPSGACAQSPPIQIIISTLDQWGCKSGTWALIGSGGGGGPPTGPAGGVLTGTYPNPSGLTTAGVQAAIQGQSINPLLIGSIFVNNVQWAQPYYTSCTINAIAYTTNGDCAYFQALYTAQTSGQSVDLYFGDFNWSQCVQWPEPTGGFYSVNIHGSSIFGTQIFGTCSHPTQAMLTKTGGSSFVHMDNLTWQTNGNFGSCYDLTTGVVGGTIDNVNCYPSITTATSGLDHAVQLGSSGSYATDLVISNLLIGVPYTTVSPYASLTGTGTTSLTGITINSGGGGYQTGYAKGVVNDPHHYCSVEPAFAVSLTSGAITGTTITAAGTCSGGLPDLSAINQINITYGAQMYLSDSKVDYFEPLCCVTGGIFHGGNTGLYHAHPTNIQSGVVINADMNLHDTECDTIAGNCIQWQGTWGSTVDGTHGVILPNLPGASVYQFAVGAANVNFGPQADLCGLNNPTDYQEFISTTGTLTPGGSGWPTGSPVIGNDRACAYLGAGQNIDYDPYLAGVVTSIGVTTANGVSGTSSGGATPSLTLTLGAITPTSTNGVSAATMAFVDPTSSIQTQLNAKGSGTVTSIGVTTANGVSGTSSGGATPSLTIALGAINPSSVGATTPGTGAFTSMTATSGVTATADGTHAGYMGVVGNTTLPTLPTSTFDIIGPSVASFTAYAWQVPSTGPSAVTVPELAALSGGVSQVSYVSPSTLLTTAQCLAAAVPIYTPCVVYASGPVTGLTATSTTTAITLYSGNAPAGAMFEFCPSIYQNSGTGTIAGQAEVQVTWTTPGGNTNSAYELSGVTFQSGGYQVEESPACPVVSVGGSSTLSEQVLAVGGTGTVAWEYNMVITRKR